MNKVNIILDKNTLKIVIDDIEYIFIIGYERDTFRFKLIYNYIMTEKEQTERRLQTEIGYIIDKNKCILSRIKLCIYDQKINIILMQLTIEDSIMLSEETSNEIINKLIECMIINKDIFGIDI